MFVCHPWWSWTTETESDLKHWNDKRNTSAERGRNRVTRRRRSLKHT